MGVQKSLADRSVMTLKYGEFDVRETVRVCLDGCRYPSGGWVTERSSTLADLVMPRKGVGYDVMVFIGRQRFEEHRQREEIQDVLSKEPYHLSISTGQISMMAHLFLEYLQRLHEARARELRAALDSDGGWPLHIDATGEDGRGTLLVALSGWRKWVLGAWKIPTEREEHMVPHLSWVLETFGSPCAIMRDLGAAVAAAAEAVVEDFDLQIPILACHQHFLADVGEDLLDEHHNSLRKLFRRFNIRQKLNGLSRELGRRLDTNVGQAREALLDWQEHGYQDHFLPSGDLGLAIVRGLCQWALDFHADGGGYGFPYDRPYLNLFNRCRYILRATDAFARTPPNDPKVRKALRRLSLILQPLLHDKRFSQLSRDLKARVDLFEELRSALRLMPSSPIDRSQAPSPQELNDIEAAVQNLSTSLRERRPSRGPALDTRDAIDTLLQHLSRHEQFLWGHVIPLPTGTRLVDRTNNMSENFFHGMKHLERRRSGRKNLTQDFEQLPPAAALVHNLKQPDYVSIVSGSIDNLPHAFAQLDKLDHAKAQFIPQTSQKMSRSDQIATAALPLEDKKIIRRNSMRQAILSAARSRAPRVSL